jgi:hypothetical protein
MKMTLTCDTRKYVYSKESGIEISLQIFESKNTLLAIMKKLKNDSNIFLRKYYAILKAFFLLTKMSY